MHSPTCVSGVVCVACKLHPCLTYSRCRDRIDLVLLRSYYKGGGYKRHHFCPCAKNKKGPKPGEHVLFFCMKRGRNKVFYSEKC